MEFNSSGFGARVGINVLDSNSLRYKLNDLNDSVELINLNNIDQFLLEELNQLGIDLGSNLGIFKGEGSQVGGEEMDEMLGPGVLDGDLNGPAAVNFNSGETVWGIGLNSWSLKKGVQISVELKSIVGVFSSKLGELAVP